MTWIEFLTIYLACGAPFAVYRATQVVRPVTTGHLVRLLVALLAWPVFALGALSAHLSKRDGSDDLADRIKRARTAIEEIAFPTHTAKPLVEFRDVFDRYTGLALAIRDAADPPAELYEISGHTRPEVATRVVARRNREKLLFHHTNARNEFVDLIAELSLHRGEVVQLACGLADMLDDPDAVADLSALVLPQTIDQRERPTSAAASVR